MARQIAGLAALALAVLLIAQPLLHNHALDEKVATPCSVCVFGADRIAAAPSLDAPPAHALAFATVADAATTFEQPLASSPRAPPSAA